MTGDDSLQALEALEPPVRVGLRHAGGVPFHGLAVGDGLGHTLERRLASADHP